MVSVSIETPEQAELRLRRVIAEADLRVFEGAWCFEEFPVDQRPALTRDALALVRDEHSWSRLVPLGDEHEDLAELRAGTPAGAVGGNRTPATPERPGDGGLGVMPTPDDGNRRSTEQPWDESTRPTGPAPDPHRTYSAAERARGAHLIEVHNHLRSELARLGELVQQVATGAVGPGAARSHIATMTMRQNNWTLGTYCEQYCRVVTIHHSIEDLTMIPQLAAADPRLKPVLDRISQEHMVIHEILERVDRALVAFVSDAAAAGALHDAVNLLTDALLSHLSYEERELVEPLARIPLD